MINRSLPAVSYLTSLDIYSITNIVLLCVIASWHAVVAKLNDPFYAATIDRYVCIGFAILCIMIQILLIIRLLLPYRDIKILKTKEKEFLKTFQKNKNYQLM